MAGNEWYEKTYTNESELRQDLLAAAYRQDLDPHTIRDYSTPELAMRVTGSEPTVSLVDGRSVLTQDYSNTQVAVDEEARAWRVHGTPNLTAALTAAFNEYRAATLGEPQSADIGIGIE